MEILNKTKELLHNAHAFEQLARALPPGAELSVSIDDRIFLSLTLKDGALSIKEHASKNADLELLLRPEGVRKLLKSPPEDLISLGKELSRGALSEDIKLRLKSDINTLKEKGYLNTLKKLGLELQGELMQQGLILLGTAQSLVQLAKSRLFKR